MNRILVGGILTAFLLLFQPSLARMAQDKAPVDQEKVKAAPEKRPAHWETVQKIKMLRLWGTKQGPDWPQIAILQLSRGQQKELESEPLAFYEKYQVFGPYKVEHAQGHFMLRLIKEDKAGSTDPVIAVVVHDQDTYSGFALFEVAEIK